LPAAIGSSGQVLQLIDGSGTLSWATPLAGDVVGPSSSPSMDNKIALFDGITGKLLKQSTTLSNSGSTLNSTSSLTLDPTGNLILGLTGSEIIVPGTTSITDIGETGTRFKDLWLSGTGTMGALSVDTISIDGSTVTGSGNITLDPATNNVIIDGNVQIQNNNSLQLFEDSGNGTEFTGLEASSSITSSYTIVLPPAVGSSGQILQLTDGSGTLAWTTPNDISGPGSSDDNRIVLFNGTTGELIKQSTSLTVSGTTLASNSSLTIDPTGDLTLSLTGTEVVKPGITAITDLGTTAVKFKDLWLSGLGTMGSLSVDTLLIDGSTISGTSDIILDPSSSNVLVDGNVKIQNNNALQLFEASGSGTEFIGLKAASAITTSYTITLPSAIGSSGQVLQLIDGSGTLSWITPNAGDVEGPNFSVDNRIALFDNATGKLIKQSTTLSVSGSILSSTSGLSIDPVGDITFSLTGTEIIKPGTTAITDLGATTSRFKDLWLSGAITAGSLLIDTISIDGSTISGSGNIILDPVGGNVAIDGNIQANNNGALQLFEDSGSGTEFTGIKAASSIVTSYTITLPSAVGSSGQILQTVDASGTLSWTTPATGNVIGPGSSTDNHIALFDNVTGKLLKQAINLSVSGTILSSTSTLSINPDGDLILSLIGSEIVKPGTTATTDIGATGTRFKDLWLSGTAYAGALNVDTLTIDSSTISGTSDITLDPAGGNILIDGNVQIDDQKELQLHEANASGSDYVGIKAPSSVTATYSIIMPAAVGSSGQVLQTVDGSGTLSWITPKGGDVVGPGSSVDNRIALFDDVTGKIIKQTINLSISGTTLSSTEELTLDPTGNLVLGLTGAEIIVPGATGITDLGATGTRFKDLWLSGTVTAGALSVDTLSLDGSTISSSSNITLDPAGNNILADGNFQIQNTTIFFHMFFTSHTKILIHT